MEVLEVVMVRAAQKEFQLYLAVILARLVVRKQIVCILYLRRLVAICFWQGADVISENILIALTVFSWWEDEL